MARTKNSKFQESESENFNSTKNSKILKNSKFDYLKQLREERERKQGQQSDKKKTIPLDDLLYLNHDFDDRDAFIRSQQPEIIKTYTKNSNGFSDSDNLLLRTQSDMLSRTSKSRKGEDIIKRNIKNLKKLKPINKEKLKRPKSYKGPRKPKKVKKRKRIKEHLYKYSNPLERELTSFIEDDCELMMSYSILDDVEDPNAEDDPRKLVKPRVIDPLQKSDLFWKMQNNIKKVYSRGIVNDFEQSMKSLNFSDMNSMGDTRNKLSSMSSLTLGNKRRRGKGRRGKSNRVVKEEEEPQVEDAYERRAELIDYGDDTHDNLNQNIDIPEQIMEEDEQEFDNGPRDKYKYNFEVIDEFEDEGSVNPGRDTQGRFRVPEAEKTHGNGLGFAYDSKADTYYKVKTKGSFGYKGSNSGAGAPDKSNSRYINIEINQNLDNFSETVKSEMNPFAPFDSKYTDLNKQEKGIRRTNPKEEYLKKMKKNQPNINLKIKDQSQGATSRNSTSRQQSHQNSYASNFSKRKNAAFRSANSSTISQKSGKKRFKRKAHKMPKFMNEKGNMDENESDLAASNVVSEKDLIVVDNSDKKGKRKTNGGNPGTLKVNPNVNLKDLFS